VRVNTVNRPPPPDVSITSPLTSPPRRPATAPYHCHLTCSRPYPASVSFAMSSPESTATSPCRTHYPPDDVIKYAQVDHFVYFHWSVWRALHFLFYVHLPPKLKFSHLSRCCLQIRLHCLPLYQINCPRHDKNQGFAEFRLLTLFFTIFSISLA